MARFFVGQRVRIVSVECQENYSRVGKEDRVFASHGVCRFQGGKVSDAYTLEGDSSQDKAGGLEGQWSAWSYDQLEPILPDGHRAGDFTSVHDLLESLSKEVA